MVVARKGCLRPGSGISNSSKSKKLGFNQNGVSIAAVVCTLVLTIWLSPRAETQNRSTDLGAKYDATGTSIMFRVYSAHATRIDLYIYAQPTGVNESVVYHLAVDSTKVWSVKVPVADLQKAGINGTVYYGYRAWGPNWPFSTAWKKGSLDGFIVDVDVRGNRFNPNKLLLDPYALEVSHDPLTPNQRNATLYLSGPEYRVIDDGTSAPKGIVLPAVVPIRDSKPTRLLKDDIIYEVHVRGFTMSDPTIPAQYRGTYKGAAMKAGYLADLGITAVEFLPVQETQNDANDVDAAQANYWGYMPLNFFAPDRRYSSNKTPGGPTKEFQEMVKAFHNRGIEVFVDVVYGHTWEGGTSTGNDPNVLPIISWRGLDNPSYYTLAAVRRYSVDNTGCCGGNYNAHNPAAQNLIVDALAYYRDTMGVDGFRFDQAPILGNSCRSGCYRFDAHEPTGALAQITARIHPRDLAGNGTDLIAEPWADQSYQAGTFPPGWSEWNDAFRDTIKLSQNALGLPQVTPGQLAVRLAGSSDRFQKIGREPWNSVNYLTSHDEPPLHDIYSCNESAKIAWDHAGNATAQRQAARTGFALLLLSAGTPMFAGGDEFLRSIDCKINPFNLDTAENWLNYTWDAEQATFNTFAKRLIAFRKAHPSLSPADFYSGKDHNGNAMEDLAWFEPDGTQITAHSQYWDDTNANVIAFRIDGTEFNDTTSAIYVAYNGRTESVTFTMPSPGLNNSWYRVMDTAGWNEGTDTVVPSGNEAFVGGQSTKYNLAGESVLLLIARKANCYYGDWRVSAARSEIFFRNVSVAPECICRCTYSVSSVSALSDIEYLPHLVLSKATGLYKSCTAN